MRKFMSIFIIILVAMFVFTSCGKDEEESKAKITFLTIGTGGITGVYYPTGGAITLEQAALCEPYSIGTYTVQRGDLTDGAKVAIVPLEDLEGFEEIET